MHMAPIRPSAAARPLPLDPIAVAAEAYRSHGGLAAGDELAQRLLREYGCSRPTSLLARRIVERQVISFQWQGTHWPPLAQFVRAGPHVKSSVQAALDELRHVFDETELAIWFAEPNDWLDGARPIEVVDCTCAALHRAARADRYIAAGS
jgi:hypothetical protein